MDDGSATPGDVLESNERAIRILVSRPELAVLDFDAGPDYEGAGPHFHKEHVDSFYVLEGELKVHLGDETVRVVPGTFVSVPPDTVHAFRKSNPGRARFLNIHAPQCGFVEYLRRASRGERPNPEDFDIWDAD